MIIRQSGIVEELDLAAHGLRYIDCDPWGFAPAPSPGDAGPDGRPLVFSVDLDATCASIAAACGPDDAAAYRRFVAVWARRSRAVAASFGRRPDRRRPGPLLLADRRARPTGRPRTPGGDLAVDFLGSGDALLDRWFGSERLKAALAWFGAQSGPPMSEPGTAAMVGWAALLHDVPPGHPVGGSGGLTAALRRRLEADGGRVVLGDGAARLLVEDDGGGPRVTGVETASGRRIAPTPSWPPATSVATRELAGDDAPPALADADPPLGNGFGLVVRALTDALPRLSRASRRAVVAGTAAAVHRPRAARRRARRLGGRPAAARAGPAGDVASRPATTPSPRPGGTSSRSGGSGTRTPWPTAPTGTPSPSRGAAGSSPPSTGTPRLRRLGTAAVRTDTARSWSANCPCPVATSCTWRWGWPACSASGRRRRCPATRVPGLPGLYLAGASTHPGGGVSGNSGPDGGPRAARRPARAARPAARGPRPAPRRRARLRR